jgi:hypothetical protein
MSVSFIKIAPTQICCRSHQLSVTTHRHSLQRLSYVTHYGRSYTDISGELFQFTVTHIFCNFHKEYKKYLSTFNAHHEMVLNTFHCTLHVTHIISMHMTC